MPKIAAFDGYLVKAEKAEVVVSPAYDSVSAEHRRRFAADNPQNFLNTMRLMEDYPEDSKPDQDELLLRNREALHKLLNGDWFNKISSPCLFLYQLDSGTHSQIGVVCEVPVSEYENGNMRKHENTRSDKEDLLANYQKVVGASSSPICLAYSQRDDIDKEIDRLAQSRPDLEFTSEDGVVQKIWCIENSADQDKLIELFAGFEITYLTDGHHRAASGRRYAEIMREEKGNRGDEPYNQLLVSLFPDNQLNLYPFHRCVRDLNGLSEAQVVEALKENFEVESLQDLERFDATQHGEFGMLVNHNWYRLNVRPQALDSDHPVDSLDVSILQNLILDPILGIKDVRADPRLDYVAGVSGDQGIQQMIADGWQVIFSCYPTSIEQLMNVADAGGLMPPKSTYFDPKPRSGVFVRIK